MRDDLTALCAAFAEKYGQGPMEARTAIEGLAQHGTITPCEAEEWAREAGEAPFEEDPDPIEFDPKAVVYWTLGMATAWVLWRTDDAVRDEWEPFISRRWRWMPYSAPEARATAPGGRVNVKGHVAQTVEPHGAWGVVKLAAMFPTVLRTQSEDTEREMLAALQKGDLAAIQGDDEHVREVLAMAWVGLSPFSPGRREQHDAVFARGDPREPKLHHVKVRSADVLRLWPALDAPDAFALAVAGALADLPDGGEVPSGKSVHAATSTMRGKEAREFIASAGPPLGLSSDAFVVWATERASAINRKIHRDDVRAYHRSEAYVGTRQRGRPRKSAE